MRTLLPLLVASLSLLATPALAETVTVPFNVSSNGTSGGVLTSQTYVGDVTITVSGTGTSRSQDLNDAFYVYTGGPIFYNPDWYHLRIGTAHPVSQLGGSPPPYNSSHVYTFTWNVASPQQLRFWVSDGVFTDNTGSYTITVTPAAAPPVADAGPAVSGDEGGSVLLDGTGSTDANGPIVSWEWDCTDDGVIDGTGSTFACSYLDDGVYTARLTVTDGDGATDDDTTTVTIGNLPPVASGLSLPTDLDEGSMGSFSGAATDPGASDVLTWTWTWGDGTADGVGSPATHAYADEGTFAVSAVVDDGDGGSDSVSGSVTVNNVAPVITSAPGGAAPEGVAWSYAPTAVDPGVNDVLTWGVSPSAPAAMTVDSATGALAWTPAYADVGTWSFTLSVDDGDGGSDAQAVTLVVTAADVDGDGLEDGWELANGLDPADPSDAAGDPDGDGLTNLDEFQGGTDPNVFDGPTAPVLVDPIAGAETEASPDLLVDNATDPNGDALTLDYEVFSDAALTTLVTGATVAQDASGQTTWKVDVALPENTLHWWRARAADALADGPWAPAEEFFVNAVNEPPTAPTAASPLDGELVASLAPTLQMGASTDPDGDAVTYTFEVADAPDGAVLASATDLLDGGSLVEWTVDVTLTEDVMVWLRGRATDEHGLSGDWSPWIGFLPTADDGAPAGLAWIEPADGDVLGTASPVLAAGGAVDPEGAALVYVFEVVGGATSPDLPETEGVAYWDLQDAGISLTEDAEVELRVRAGDGAVWSGWEAITVFVNAEDATPSVPVLVAPADGTGVGEERPLDLTAAWSADPDLDLLRYDFVVARDEELTDVVAEISGLDGGNASVDGTGEVTWPLSAALPAGTLFWSARATDGALTSEWAAPWTLEVAEVEVPVEDPIPADPETPECGCTAASSGTPAWSLLLGMGLLLGWRRRR